MAPFLLFLTTTILLRLLGMLAIPAFTLPESIRYALVPLFLLTASAHWGKRRPDLVRTVPRSLPHPEFIITLTGILEIVGALGLLIAPLAPYAALGLSLLLIAVFPANIKAARENLSIGGTRATKLPLRAAIQIIFLLATLSVVIHHWPRR